MNRCQTCGYKKMYSELHDTLNNFEGGRRVQCVDCEVRLLTAERDRLRAALLSLSEDLRSDLEAEFKIDLKGGA